MSFVRDQWYVAAYSAEVGRALLARTILASRWCCTGPVPGSRPRWRTAASTGTSRCPQSQLDGDTIVCGYHGFTYGPDGRLRRGPRAAAHPADRTGQRLPGRRAGLASSGSGSATPTGPTPAASRVRPWLDRPGLHHRPRHGAAGGPVRAAGGQPDGPVARDLPARRVHRHPRGRGHPDQHRDRRGAAASSGSAAGWTTPRARRSTRESTGISGRIVRWQDIEYRPPCLYLLHSRVAPAGVLPRPDGTDPRRLPRRGGLRHHPVHRDEHV